MKMVVDLETKVSGGQEVLILTVSYEGVRDVGFILDSGATRCVMSKLQDFSVLLDSYVVLRGVNGHSERLRLGKVLKNDLGIEIAVYMPSLHVRGIISTTILRKLGNVVFLPTWDELLYNIDPVSIDISNNVYSKSTLPPGIVINLQSNLEWTVENKSGLDWINWKADEKRSQEVDHTIVDEVHTPEDIYYLEEEGIYLTVQKVDNRTSLELHKASGHIRPLKKGEFCSECEHVRGRRRNIRKDMKPHKREPLHEWSGDFWGPFEETISNSTILLVVVDISTRYIMIFPLAVKSEIVEVIKRTITETRAKYGDKATSHLI